jgi:hypothetical protein
MVSLKQSYQTPNEKTAIATFAIPRAVHFCVDQRYVPIAICICIHTDSCMLRHIATETAALIIIVLKSRRFLVS